MNTKNIGSKILTFFKNRIKSGDIYSTGLNNYYAERIKKGAILSENDYYLIDEIQKRYPPGTFIHEMACGAAQLGHYLSSIGYTVVASECDITRFRLSSDLGEYLGSHCVVVYGNSFELKTAAKVYVTANAESSHVSMKNNIGFIKSKIAEGCDLILNVDLYGESHSDNRKILTENKIEFVELEKGFIFIGKKDV
jgi:hypothetical protein